jgi:hypothetical protein
MSADSPDPDHHQTIPESELIADIKYVADKLGHPPRRTEYDERGLFSTDTCYVRFGGWPDAIEAAGFDYDDVPDDADGRPKQYSDGELLDWIISWRVEFGVWPRPDDIQDPGTPTPSLGTYRRRFGSLVQAREKAKARFGGGGAE